MADSFNFKLKLENNQSIDVNQLDLENPNFYHSIQCAIMVGNPTESINVILNGEDVVFPGGFVFNQIPIITLTVFSSTNGVLIIGKKTKKQIF